MLIPNGIKSVFDFIITAQKYTQLWIQNRSLTLINLISRLINLPIVKRYLPLRNKNIIK